MIPISISTSKSGGKEVVSTVLDKRSMEVTLPVGPNDWIKINPGTIGYYRTQYPSALLSRFFGAIQDKSLPPLDRLGLLEDLFAMVRTECELSLKKLLTDPVRFPQVQAGETSTIEVLNMMEAFIDEDNYTVWSSINSCLGKLRLLLSHTDLEENLKACIRVLMTPVYKRLGWEPKSNESKSDNGTMEWNDGRALERTPLTPPLFPGHLDTLLRSLVIGSLAGCAEESVVAESKKRFEAHCSGKALIPADLRTPVYRAVMSCGNESTYEAFLKLYREADLHEEKDRICRNLGAIKDEKILAKVLDFAISDEVRNQDSVFVIISVAAFSAVGRDLAWEFFKDHWEMFLERYQVPNPRGKCDYRGLGKVSLTEN